MSEPNVEFYYGQNLKATNPDFSAGAIYFDTVKKQIWYDDPKGTTSSSRSRLTTLSSCTILDSLPTNNTNYKHQDMVIVQNIPYIFNEDTQTWICLNAGHKATQIDVDYTQIQFDTSEIVVEF